MGVMTFDVAEWRTVDNLVEWLKKKHCARLVRRAEGPDARSFFLKLADGDLRVDQWDWGDVRIEASSESLMGLLQECKLQFADP